MKKNNVLTKSVFENIAQYIEDTDLQFIKQISDEALLILMEQVFAQDEKNTQFLTEWVERMEKASAKR